MKNKVLKYLLNKYIFVFLLTVTVTGIGGSHEPLIRGILPPFPVVFNQAIMYRQYGFKFR